MNLETKIQSPGLASQFANCSRRLATLATVALAVCSIQANAAIDNAEPDSELLKSVISSQPSCDNFLRFDANNTYFGFGAYRFGFEEPRPKLPGHVTVRPFNGSDAFDLATLDSAVDITTVGETAYILTYTGLEQWDLSSRARVANFATYDMDREMKYKEHAMALAKFENTLIIAHGRMGVSFFDLTTHKLISSYRLVPEQKPLQSMAVGVTIQVHYAYVAVDNFNFNPDKNLPAFRGVVVIDMQTQKIVAQLEGIDAGVTSVVSDAKNLVFTFGGIPLWKYDINNLGDKKLSEPKEKAWVMPNGVQPIGHAELDSKYYYTCATLQPETKGGKFTRRPLALDRKAIKMN